MATPRTPQDLLVNELKEIHSAERQLSRAIPRLSRNVQNEQLKRQLETRRQQGERLIEALDEAFDRMGTTKARPKNPAAEGLLADMNEHLESIEDEAMLDAVLLAGIQKLEHYCIAAWGTSRSLAQSLGQQEVVKAMERELEEGKRLDQELTQLAEREINPAMMQAGQGADGEGGQRRGRGSGGQESRATH